MIEASCLVDTNVILRWVQTGDPEYTRIAKSLNRLVQRNVGLCYTSQNVAEFWNACTRPLKQNGYGLTPAQADLRARFFESRLDCLPDSVLVHEEWRRLIVAYNVSGAEVHDARLVPAMHVHGVSNILTFNARDFARFSRITVLHP